MFIQALVFEIIFLMRSFFFVHFFKTQSFYRGWQARGEVKKLKAAVLIQSRVRGMIQRRKYCRVKQLVIRLQAAARARCRQKNYRELKAATVFLQRRVRANIAARKGRREFVAAKRAAVTLQSFYCGWKARCGVRQLKAAILIQGWFRGTMAGKKACEEYRRVKEATIMIQAAYRGHRGRMVARKVRAARTIQVAVRGFIIRRRIDVRVLFSSSYGFSCVDVTRN